VLVLITRLWPARSTDRPWFQRVGGNEKHSLWGHFDDPRYYLLVGVEQA
jgi:hypothetical protein